MTPSFSCLFGVKPLGKDYGSGFTMIGKVDDRDMMKRWCRCWSPKLLSKI